MNPHRKPLRIGSMGVSSTTLQSSLEHIRKVRPAIVVLENVVNKAAIEVVRKEIAGISGYSSIVFLMDSQKIGVCMSRRRMHVVAIDMRQKALTIPVQEWRSQLEAIASSIAPESLEDMRAECTTANQHRKQLVRMKSKKWVVQRQAVRGAPK